jgi:hypothetical protein
MFKVVSKVYISIVAFADKSYAYLSKVLLEQSQKKNEVLKFQFSELQSEAQVFGFLGIIIEQA